jgi:hypothetical protein
MLPRLCPLTRLHVTVTLAEKRTPCTWVRRHSFDRVGFVHSGLRSDAMCQMARHLFNAALKPFRSSRRAQMEDIVMWRLFAAMLAAARLAPWAANADDIVLHGNSSQPPKAWLDGTTPRGFAVNRSARDNDQRAHTYGRCIQTE